jgi:glycosyltransferase involved in cell wall biosynthesis
VDDPRPTGDDGWVDVLALIDHFVLGGAETLLARFALAAPRARINLTVACLHELNGNPAARPLVASGRPPINLGIHKVAQVRTLAAVRKLIVRTSPQIVHTHLGGSDVLGGLVARFEGIPAISSIHSTRWTGARTRVERTIVRGCAARIVAVSESARRQYLEAGYARPEQIVTIRNGTDAEPEPGSGRAVRQELGLAHDDLVVVMVSALRAVKGHHLAIDAIEALLPRYPHLRLVIVGEGDLADELARRAAGLDGAVVLAGLRPDVMRVLDAADICLHPSAHEAFPTTLLEAMAASVPIIASAVGGVPEIVSSPDLGVLIDPPPTAEAIATALTGLLDSPSQRRRLAANARQAYLAEFTATPWVHRMRRLYDDVLLERAGARSPQRPRRALVTR